MARTVHCVKLNKEAEGLEFPPVPGEMGKKLYLSVSKEAWQGWLKHQTMLINENRLNLADDRARKYLATQMEKHFFGEGADVAQGYVPPAEYSSFPLKQSLRRSREGGNPSLFGLTARDSRGAAEDSRE